MKNIYLIGFMGSGKTTIGSCLQPFLQKDFIDIDQWIEAKVNMKIPTIFATKGESFFRKYETICLKEISKNTIVATGGGIVEVDENIQLMKKNGTLIYLHTTFDEITKRLKSNTTRPLWNAPIDERIRLYNRRISLYEKHADIIVETTEKTSEHITKEIVKHLHE